MTRVANSIIFALGIGVVAIACNGDKPGSEGDGGANDGGSTDCTDADGDTFCAEDDDCNDGDASVNPDAAEICDSVDNNCDGTVDEGVSDTYYDDADGDGFGDPRTGDEACEALPGTVDNDDDCDDADNSVYPGATEECDGVDNDCDGDIDEELDATTWYADDDGDGYGDPDSTASACEQPTGYVSNDWDCDDTDWGEPVHVAPGPVSSGTGGDSGGTGVPSDVAGSASNPYATIQEGINAAEVCVHVYTDTYNEDIDFSGKNILVIGIEGKDSTIIEGTGRAPVVTFDSGETKGARLSGFTITGGTGARTSATDTDTCGPSGEDTCVTTTTTYMGGGIYVNGASPTLDDLIVENNKLAAYSYTETSSTEFDYVYSYGGGMYVADGAPTVDDVVFRTNYADAGGGLYATDTGSVAMTWTTFDENSASSGGGFASAGSISAVNSILVNNTASSDGSSIGGAGADVADGTTSLTNVAGAGNDGMGSLYIGASGSAEVMNTILVENEDGYVVDGESGASHDISYSDVYSSDGDGAYSSVIGDQTGSNGNISESPAFTSWSDNDNFSDDNLRLKSTSPGIDAGNPASAYNDVDGSTNDMGAYGGPNGE